MDDFVCMLFHGGAARFILDGDTVHCRQGEMLLVSVGVAFDAYAVQCNPPRFSAVKFDIRARKGCSEAVGVGQPFWIRHRPASLRRYERFLAAAKALEREPDMQAAVGGSVHTMLALWAQELCSPRRASDPRLEEAVRKIEENPAQRLAVAELAREVGFSPRYFARRFAGYTGLTPHSYRIRSRVRHAQYLLEQTDMSVKQVAFEVGYPDPYAFSKQFKQVMGRTPSGVRQS